VEISVTTLEPTITPMVPPTVSEDNQQQQPQPKEEEHEQNAESTTILHTW
jgi:hypothetical protein